VGALDGYYARNLLDVATVGILILHQTHPKIEALLIEGYRKMSVSQKLECVCALTQAVQDSRFWTSGGAIRTRMPASRPFGSRRAGSSPS
jgi:hypothetical protein